MMSTNRLPLIVRSCAALLVAALPTFAPAQSGPPRVTSPDSVAVAASKRYEAGSFKRAFLGNTYRDYWVTPVRVPVVDLRRYDGGLKPLEQGGGKQTKTLRLGTPTGEEYVFRPVDKATVNPPEWFRRTLVAQMFRDQVSAMFPAAAIVAAPIVDAAGVLHATPQLAVLPNDALLGKFREDYLNQLGSLEEYPNVPDDAPGFEGAVEIVDSKQLVPLLDRSSTHQVDARAFLRARLTDFLIGDLDRHPGNWKWARFAGTGNARWYPIPRDRDHAFHNYDGFLTRLASMVAPNLTKFEGRYPGISALTHNSRDIDRRLLTGLEKSAWDTVALALTRRITDAVIDSAVRQMPVEYRAAAPSFAAKIKQRRDGLRAIANEYYATLARYVDVHATDAADRATVTYLDGGLVDVRLQSGDAAPYFQRRFDARETAEVRVYLHDGDDAAVVRGHVASGLPVRVVGGNGTNELVDSSRVGGGRVARLYDVGQVSGVRYGPKADRDTTFNRRPWVNDTGSFEAPERDFGQRFKPIAELDGGTGLGLVPQLGVEWYRYGFRNQPYKTKVTLEAAYSTSVAGYRVMLTGDRRLADSRLHYVAAAGMSDFEVINFHGFGNDVGGEPENLFEVRQRQWSFHPALAFALRLRDSDVTFGPVVRYSTTDSMPGRFIARETPYGAGGFGQAGVRLGLRYDRRDNEDYATRGFLVDVAGSAYPAVWDVESTYSKVGGFATTFFTLPLPKRPTLAFRGGGQKVWGDAPYFDAAFIGGRGTIRAMDAQRYAGDASLFGTSELRVPLGRIPFLVPLDVGALAFSEAGRVYVNGRSPGGWHSIMGAGLWFGIVDPGTGFSVLLTNSEEKRVYLGTGLKF